LKKISIELSVFHMVETHAIQFRYMIVIERVKHLTSILAAADEAHLAQPAKLMGYGRFGHGESVCNITYVHFAIEQNGNDPQAGGVTEGTEQVSKVGGGLFFKKHCEYMNSCSSIQYYRTEIENRQMAILNFA
jgi:hypothetical protein